jgi:hypothetical protein
VTTAVPQPAPPTKGLLGWLYGHVRALLLLAVATVAILGGLIYTGVLGIDRLDEEIRARVEAKIAGEYPLLSVKVESAQLLHGRGIQIRGLTITDPNCDPKYAELVYVDEILAACDTSLQELLTHEPHVTAITVRRPRLRATRLAGTWNTTKLLPLPKFQKTQCPTVVEDASIEICDPACNAGQPLKLSHLDVTIAPDVTAEALTFLPESQTKAPLKVTGQVMCDHFKRVTLDGWFDPAGGVWAFRGDIERLVITPALESSLPVDVPTRLLSLHDLHGKLTLAYEVTNQRVGGETEPTQLPFRFEIAGKLEEARLEDRRLPYPLTELSAQVHCDDQGVELTDVKALCGAAKLSASLTRTGWTTNAPLVLKARVTQLALDSSLSEALSEKQRAVWDRFLPSGAVNANFSLTFDGIAWQHDIAAELLNVSVAFDKFPYRVTNGSGHVRLTNRELTVEAFAAAGRQRVDCKAYLVHPGPQFTGWVDIVSEGPVALDEKLLLAMDEKTQKIVRSLSPRGEGKFHFRIDRPDAEQPIEPYLAVALTKTALRYEKFPYPLDTISGNIIWHAGEWTFEKFEGSNDSAYVLATGTLKRDARGESQLHLEFSCADVPLEDDLKQALPEKLQALWSGLSPSGTLDQVVAIIDYNCDTKALAVDVKGNKYARPEVVDTRSVSMEPAWFPYRLDHVIGSFHYKNGDIQLKGLKAQHDRTRVSLDGFCQLNPDGGWSFNVDRFHADRVEVDHQLLQALPAKASEVLTKLKLQGPLHVIGSGNVTSDGRTAQPSSATWDVAIDLENGSIDAGTPLNHIHGSVKLTGSANAQGYTGQGEIALDSVMVRDVQVTQVLGPLSLDGSRILLGAWAKQTRQGPPRQITAKVFEGTVASDAVLALNDEGAFEVQASLTDASLARIASEMVAQRSKITGKAQGYVKLAGTRQGRHTWNGGGVVRLRDADIYELPVMVALLKVLSIREPDKTAFNTADLDYRIQGDHIYLDRLDFHGDAITLKGSGEMDWTRHLNLQFYSMVGRDELQLPVLRPLLGEASRNLMMITVNGTLDKPDLRREAFPGLNETLQRVFPEAKRK